MFRLLRKISIRLTERLNLKRFIFYAVGEIFLVMVGILLALQVDNWNKDRTNRQLEKYYLSRIIIDLQKDLEELNQANEISLKRIVMISELLKEIGIDPMAYIKDDPGDSQICSTAYDKFSSAKASGDFGSRIGNVYWTRYFDHTDVTFQELITTSKIEVIEDRALRDLIQRHYSDVKEMMGIQDYFFQAQKDYLDVLKENGITPRAARVFPDLKEKVSKDVRIKTELLNLMETTIDITIPLQQVQTKTEQLIKEITKETEEIK